MFRSMPSKYVTDHIKSFSFPPALARSLTVKGSWNATHCLSPQGWRAKQDFPAIPLSRRSTMTTPVVLITGALTGIGRATALAFAQEGARIVISGRRDEAGQKLVAELRQTGVEAEDWRADVRHDEDVRDLAD